jgi:DNA-binding response OmpR family regulator
MKGTVLVVDDDLEVVNTFSNWLRLEGFEVRTASDGEAALGQVRGSDAIILDVRMPILDGIGFLRRIRAQNERVPVVIVTGDYLIDEALVHELTSLNAQVVFKPLWLDDLMALTSDLVSRGALA